MKLSQASQYLPLIQAAAQGKTIQIFSFGEWDDLNPEHDSFFNVGVGRYRIKPEKKIVDFYLLLNALGDVNQISEEYFNQIGNLNSETAKAVKLTLSFES